jgi:hypothetical protein
VFGPGGKLVSQGAIERAIQPAKPVRAWGDQYDEIMDKPHCAELT